jgi:hypothetical protein
VRCAASGNEKTDGASDHAQIRQHIATGAYLVARALEIAAGTDSNSVCRLEMPTTGTEQQNTSGVKVAPTDPQLFAPRRITSAAPEQ